MSRKLIPFLVVFLSGATTQAAVIPNSLDLKTIRGLVVQHDGRWPPLDTVARDIVNSVTSQEHYKGHDPVLMFLAWTFDPQRWMSEPLITIGNAELRGELELPADQTVFSYMELISHQPLRVQVERLADIEPGRKPNPLEAKVSQINEKLIQLQQAFSNQILRPIPDPQDPLGAWKSIGKPTSDASEAYYAVKSAWADTKRAFLADDAEAFSDATAMLKASLASLPAAHRPAPKLTGTELRYNRLGTFGLAWKIMVGATLLAAAALWVRRRWFDALVFLSLVAGFSVLTYGLSMRWTIAGRIPASNMYESLLFLSWGMGTAAILSIIFVRRRMVPLTASAMGAVALMLADLLPMDHFIRPIAPVLLDTIWMSIHVPIIMVSYSVLALAVLIAHVQLFAMAIAPKRTDWSETIDTVHYWYVNVGSILLLTGIITGSMWAASSWGRYWGWDPKEVWSLVAFLGYLTILHVRINREHIPPWAYVIGALMGLALFAIILPLLSPLSPLKVLGLAGAAVGMVLFVLADGRFATAIKSILAFWMIIMTYVGVNYVLGIGLHSYGFGTGAVAPRMFLCGGLDLLLVVILTLIYLARRERTPGSAGRGLPIVAAG